MTSVWPPRSSDRSAVLHAYESVLGWSLLAGGVTVGAEEADLLLGGDLAIELRTQCSDFDLVAVPYSLGLDALVVIERSDVRVPCVLSPEGVTFLVRRATGQLLADIDFVRVKAGPDALLTLPPSPDTRWDTPPWLSTNPAPAVFPDAGILAPGLAKVARTHRGTSR
jgi:hypothetical protein